MVGGEKSVKTAMDFFLFLKETSMKTLYMHGIWELEGFCFTDLGLPNPGTVNI